MTKTELREKIKGRTPYSEPELELFILPLLEQERGETAERCARVYWEESTYKKVPAYDGIKAAILACGGPDKPTGPFGCDDWVDHPDGGWRHMDNGIVNLCGSRWTHCPFCGKARVQA